MSIDAVNECSYDDLYEVCFGEDSESSTISDKEINKEIEKQIKKLQDNALICDKHMKGKNSNTALTPSQKIYEDFRQAKTNLKKAAKSHPNFLEVLKNSSIDTKTKEKLQKKCIEWKITKSRTQNTPENTRALNHALKTFARTFTAYENDPTCQKERLARKECKQTIKSLYKQNVPLAQVQKEVPGLARKIGKLYNKFSK